MVPVPELGGGVIGSKDDSVPPSIFNDVIGPVMRGPSSSHCAAALRIGRLARDLMGGELEGVLVEFHPGGSLATTHASQGSDMGLFGGLLGWEATDPRLVGSAEALAAAGIQAEVRITDFPALHPNTYRLTLKGPFVQHRMVALSTGGGIIRVVEIDGIPLSLAGDRYSTLVFLGESHAGGSKDEESPAGGSQGGEPHTDRFQDGAGLAESSQGEPQARLPDATVAVHSSGARSILQIDTGGQPAAETIQEILSRSGLGGTGGSEPEIRTLAPVLPIQSPPDLAVPFLSAAQLEASRNAEAGGGGGGDGCGAPSADLGRSLWEWAVTYESARGGISPGDVVGRMVEIIRIMEGSVREGLSGTEFDDRILPAQTGLLSQALESGSLLDAGILNRMLLYTSAIMEVKSSMGVIVAAPTAGSCGALPAAVLATGHGLDLDREAMARGMLAAGLVGVFIAARSTFAAEECGCQAECGAGSGMAAAALVTLVGGSTATALAAASMALQNTMGMVCDPVANRVEVPCLGRNVLAVSNALTSANLALAGFDPVIPLDEVIATMDQVGKALPRQLRCTALGGLSVTRTSLRIQEELEAGG